MPEFGKSIRHLWALDWRATHLNHGSYGATPKPVFAAQDAVRHDMESAIGDFFITELPKCLRAAAAEAATYLGTDAKDMVFVDNATSGMQAVIGSLAMEPADEILINDQTYNAVKNIARHAVQRCGAKLVEVTLPFPAEDDEAIVAAFTKGLSPRTRLVILDHITSATALVMPIERMIAAAHSIGALVLVDGAHGPGQIDLHVQKLNADFFCGNFHKWVMAPKGAAFLWARREQQAWLHPPVISHGYGAGYIAEFDWTGTRDPSAYLSVPAALTFRDEFGDQRIKEHNSALAAEACDYLVQTWKTRAGGYALSGASMQLVQLPFFTDAPGALRLKLWSAHRIDVPVTALAGRLWVRISAQIYNEMDDYWRLAHTIIKLSR